MHQRKQQRSQSPSPPDHGPGKSNHSQSTPHDKQGGALPTDLTRAYSNVVLIERDATAMIKENNKKLEAMLKEIECMQKGGLKIYTDLAVIAHEANALMERNNGMLDVRAQRLAQKGKNIQKVSL
ncbi:hypothetical protein AURDEDRAFT_170000 [Auricularia subglabra TFB-10046 SS5]|uniref:Uncharacterized protein n=1 Tax=Auricularia subglabra (strain TFB-10046 / SS5) TaxID=717982 RepID=J0WX55_AURST|nr:hypothetical protein AURDEDRAFT_170000 [Auricularia subglabra TFB-10046 SS5]